MKTPKKEKSKSIAFAELGLKGKQTHHPRPSQSDNTIYKASLSPPKDLTITNPAVSSVKTLYICQTYVEQKTGSDSQTGFKIDKQFEYTTVSEAQNRAGRQTLRDDCAGADAYMVSEDANSGEVGPPSFLVRLGDFPEFDNF